MTAEIGHFALILALLLAIAQSVLPMWGAARRDPALMGAGGTAATGQFLTILIAFAALTIAYATSDFTVLNVVQNSHSAKPMLYKLAGVWGNHEGSMLLWVLILALFGAMVAWFGRNLPPTLKARVLAVQGMIGVGFLLFILMTSNPFLRVDPPPPDGASLNPLLQDPGLAFHPPFLYLGYVGFSMAFSFAIAALIEGRVDAAWARWVRPWTLAAWCALTLGIALGSWWAYYELGWGGWWFWDPVENASFMPWLLGTALLHSAIVAEKRDALKSWTVLLAILTFGLSLLGTFLVRSGVLTSVHAFALDPERGVFILALLVVAIGGGLTLYAWRAPALKAGGLFAPISREGALVLNNLLLATATATVFIGTLYPLLLETLGGGRVSVGPPFFNSTFVPLMVPLVAAMAVGPLLAWKRADLMGALGRLKMAALMTAVIVMAALYLTVGGPVLALLGVAMAAWAFLGALAELADRIRLFRVPAAESLRRAKGLPRSAWGMTIAHAGLGIAIAGMTASTAFQSERIERLAPGDRLEIAGYEIEFEGVDQLRVANYLTEIGRFSVTDGDGDAVALLTPEKRWYPVAQMNTTEAAIHTNWLADLYVVLGEETEGGWTVRAYHHPLVPWIWIGCIIMVAGGATSLSDRRLRVGAPVRRRNASPAPQPAE
ncbi:heme lyase CcmF/NrfE family subunit [Inquilinus sp. CAU 1745]|uniref:heme lyase CcmF/NrfE family subunit n=1 Tax=Inquilinus sp. CAU 1745 TaxID=3140369 RepID=UPI00325AE1F3